MEEKKKSKVGIVALLTKIGSKFSAMALPLLGKLLKGAKIGKVLLATASLASYAYMFTWKFSVMLMGMLFIHESGHIWAMKKYGLKTKGIYFIPFVGGAAVSEDEFPSRKAEVVIAIMGPIWGFALALITGGVYLYTKDPLFAAVSSWMAMLNLFNLLPINPLDGGRIFKSIAFSIHSKAGLGFLAVGIIGSLILSHYAGLGLVFLLLIIGTSELMMELGRSEVWLTWSLDRLKKQLPTAELAEQEWRKEHDELQTRVEREDPGVCIDDLSAFLDDKRRTVAPRVRRKIIAKEYLLGQLETSPSMPTLDGWGVATSAAAYLTVAAVLWGLMFYMKHVPGADMAMTILKG